VSAVDERPYRSSPKAPFITSTLQQEGGRKLGLTSRQVMQAAQALYEGGYITYMRTDSVTLSSEALAAARSQVRELYGDKFLPESPRAYRSTVKNAQEAHEAIRPAGDRWRTPGQLQAELRSNDQRRLYDLIWKRTLASQMADALGKTVSVRIEAPLAEARTDGPTTTEWAASGRTITFPGYLRVYVEGSDDPEADLDDRERLLPDLVVGQVLPDPAVEPVGHTTQPPARFTEASLVKRLEELGIGRPLHVGVDHGDDPGAGLRVEEGPGAGAVVVGLRRRPAAGGPLLGGGRLHLHGPHGEPARRDRHRISGAGAVPPRLLVRQRQRGAHHPDRTRDGQRRSRGGERHPPGQGPGRRSRHGAQRQVRALPEAGRGHRVGAGGPAARRADHGAGSRAAGRTQGRRAHRHRSRIGPARVRQERTARAVCPAG
jgi:hypothetical protein